MTTLQNNWADTLVRFLSLATRLEDEGQYNLAKLARAQADALSRRAAWAHNAPANAAELVSEIKSLAAELDDLPLQTALRLGAAAITAGRPPLIQETPHPYVCRTCGYLALGRAPEKCPVCGAWVATFQWFPPVYWLEAFDPAEALERLRQTPQEVAVLLGGLSEDVLNQSPTDGGWAIRNLVTHLRDAQGVLVYRIDLFMKEARPRLEMKTVWKWARNENQHLTTTGEIFADYQAQRTELLHKLAALPLADWWRTGEHEEFGEVSIKQQVSYFAAHEMTHLPAIAHLRQQFAQP